MKPKQPLRAKKPLRTKSTLKAKAGLNATGLSPTAAKPAKKPKLRPVSKLKKDADVWFSKATRYRFADKRPDGEWWAECLTCLTPAPIKKLQCGHFMSRQYNSTRFLEQNTAPQCYGCNVMHQGRQFEFGLALDALYGAGTAKEMHDLAKQPHQFSREELLGIINDAKTEVEFYEKS
jgi:hypothetical protein